MSYFLSLYVSRETYKFILHNYDMYTFSLQIFKQILVNYKILFSMQFYNVSRETLQKIKFVKDHHEVINLLKKLYSVRNC